MNRVGKRDDTYWWLNFDSCEDLCEIIDMLHSAKGLTLEQLAAFCGSRDLFEEKGICHKGLGLLEAPEENGILGDCFVRLSAGADDHTCKPACEHLAFLHLENPKQLMSEELYTLCPFRTVQRESSFSENHHDLRYDMEDSACIRCLFSRFPFRRRLFGLDSTGESLSTAMFPIVIGGFSYLNPYSEDEEIVYATGGTGVVEFPVCILTRRDGLLCLEWDRDSRSKHAMFRKVREAEHVRAKDSDRAPYYVRAFYRKGGSKQDQWRSEFEHQKECILAFDGEFSAFGLQHFFLHAYAANDHRVRARSVLPIEEEMLAQTDVKWIWPFKESVCFDYFSAEENKDYFCRLDRWGATDVKPDSFPRPGAQGFTTCLLDFFDYLKLFEVQGNREEHRRAGKLQPVFLTERFIRLVSWLCWITDPAPTGVSDQLRPNSRWRSAWLETCGIDADSAYSELRSLADELIERGVGEEVSHNEVARWMDLVLHVLCANVSIDESKEQERRQFFLSCHRLSFAHLYARMDMTEPLAWVVFPILKMPASISKNDERLINLRGLPSSQACGFWLSLAASPRELDPSMWQVCEGDEATLAAFLSRTRMTASHLASIESAHVFWGNIVAHGRQEALERLHQYEELSHLEGVEPEISRMIREIDEIKRRAVRLERRISPSSSGLLAQDEDMIRVFKGGAAITVSLWVGKSVFSKLINEMSALKLPACTAGTGKEGPPGHNELVQGEHSALWTLENARILLKSYAPFLDALHMSNLKGAKKYELGEGIVQWSPGYELQVRAGMWGGYGASLATFHDPDAMRFAEVDLWISDYLPILFLLGLSRGNDLLVGVTSYCYQNKERLKKKESHDFAKSIFNFLKLVFHRLHHPGRGAQNQIFAAQLLAVIHRAAWKTSVSDFAPKRTGITVEYVKDDAKEGIDIGNIGLLLELLFSEGLSAPSSAKHSQRWRISKRGIEFLTALEQLLTVELQNKNENTRLRKITVRRAGDVLTVELRCKVQNTDLERFDVAGLAVTEDSSPEIQPSAHGMAYCYNCLSDSLNRGLGELRIVRDDKEHPTGKGRPQQWDIWELRFDSHVAK